MSRWKQGEAAIQQMLDAGELDQVPADADTVGLLFKAAEQHIASATLLRESDLDAAYSLAYDAGRKGATALLAHQGLRPTTKGGHLAVVRAMREQFPGVPGLSSLDMLRRRRNQSEYPDPAGSDPLTLEEVQEAIDTVSVLLASAGRLLEQPQVGVF